MAQQTFLFYDIETTGLNKCFDQVLQFAAIRTDLELNEIERHDIKVSLNCDVIPSPYAIITHGIGIEAMQSGITEVEAITKIHNLLNTPGTISLGYNTLGFDDEFLRFSFFRNLLEPYTHQYSQNCSRMDLFPMIILYYLYHHEALVWPNNNGKTNLKLEHLNRLNSLAEGPAHSAMVDVEATLALAKLLKKHRKMWDYALGYFDKATDLSRIEQLAIVFETDDRQFREALLIQALFGPKLNYQAPVLSLGQHLHYKNQTLWLKLDEENLTQTTIDNIADNTYVIRKKIAEQVLLLPTHERFLKPLDSKRIKLAEANKQWLTHNIDLLNKICEYYQNYCYPKVPHLDCNAALYETAFLSPQEKHLMEKFHNTPPENKMNITMQFSNPVYHELALRLIGRNYPETLTDDAKIQFNHYMTRTKSSHSNHKIIDYQTTPKLTPQKALTQIETICDNKEITDQQRELLSAFKEYLVDSNTVSEC